MEDRDLLERAKHFEPDALRALHERFYAAVYRYVRFKISDLQTSQDVTSEVFVRVLETLKRGRGWRSSPDAWIFGIARNVVVDHYRKRAKRVEIKLDEGIVFRADLDPLQHMLVVDQNTELRQAIASLTDEQRDVVLLRFMEGLSIKEVAEIMSKKSGAIKGLQHRAMRTLADRLRKSKVNYE